MELIVLSILGSTGLLASQIYELLRRATPRGRRISAPIRSPCRHSPSR